MGIGIKGYGSREGREIQGMAPGYKVGQKVWLNRRVSPRRRSEKVGTIVGVYATFIAVKTGNYIETVSLQDLVDGTASVEVVR